MRRTWARPWAARRTPPPGAELDLVIEHGARKIGIEIKFSSAPKPAKGFWQSLKDLKIEQAWVIAPVVRRYPLGQGVEVVPVWEVPGLVAGLGR